MMTKQFLSCPLAALLAFGLTYSRPQEQSKEPQAKQAQATAKSETKKKPRRKRRLVDLSGFDLLEPKKASQQTTVVGATRGTARPVALAPRLGKLYGLNPVFAWRHEGNPAKSVLILRDDSQEEVFRAEVTGTSYSYPSTAPPLKAEKTYFWTVEPASDVLASRSSAPVGILVVSEGQRKEIEQGLARGPGSDGYAADMARARLFTEHRLWYDAVAAYAALIARHPERAELYEERGMIYSQLKVTQALAQQDFARADELERRSAPKR